mgnify:CR=1 FL=1
MAVLGTIPSPYTAERSPRLLLSGEVPVFMANFLFDFFAVFARTRWSCRPIIRFVCVTRQPWRLSRGTMRFFRIRACMVDTRWEKGSV